jgi:RHS repeat-associated protein
VGTFTPTAGISGDTFAAYIAWGDGSQSTGTMTSNGQGGYIISSNHTYADESNANNPTNLAVVVQDTTTGLVAAQTTASVTIADAALTPTPQTITAWVNKNTGTIVVGRFSDANTAATAADFSLSPVYWGDGQSSAGTVVPIGGGQFNILASHTYTTASTYTPYVTVTDVGGSNTTVTSTATVAAPTTSTVNATENAAFSGQVAAFVGSNPVSANIQWGDGANSAGSITIVDSTHFNVSANPSHTYADEGTYNLLVTVTMSVGGPLTAAGPAVVADAALTGTGNNFSLAQGQYLGFVAGQAYTPPTIATFSDANTNAPVGDFTASINMGDGNSIAGTLATNGPAGSFKVLPASPYTYAQPGSYTITTTVTDKGSTAINLTGTATVGVIEGQQYFAVITAPLPDPITTTTIPSYTAVITWGDNSTSAGTATPQYANNGTLTGNIIVTGTHQYASTGSFISHATVTNPTTGATSTSANQTVTVVDAMLQAIPQTLTAVSANSTGTVSVAQFRDQNPLATASQFPAANVTINWGDGSGNQTGTVVAVTGATALFALQGSHTYASAGTYTITASATDTGGQSVSVTSTAIVIAPWTVAASGPLVPGSRSADPDRAMLVPMNEASVDLGAGSVRISQPLDFDQSPGTSMGGDPALDYNSADVNVRPIIQMYLQSDPNAGNPVPTQYSVAWTFNGVVQATQNFTVSGYQAGALYQLAVQVGSAVTASGVYPWSATITVTLSNNTTVQTNASGYVPVAVLDTSPYGPGWSIDGIPQVFPIAANGPVPAGILKVEGNGDFRFYTGVSPYTNPEDAGSSIVQNQNGTFTYTAADQTVWQFNTSGQLTSETDPDGLARTYAYNNGLLNQVTAPDNGVTTLTYTSGLLTKFTEPGPRYVSLTQTGNLTAIQDEAGNFRTLGYNGTHKLTSDSWAPLASSFTFDATGLLNGATLGGNPNLPYTVVSAASYGLTTPFAISYPALGAPAKLTDGNTHTTSYYLDLRGRELQEVLPLLETTSFQLNAAGDPLVITDPMNYLTVNTWDNFGNLTKVVNPDGGVDTYTFNNFQEMTSSTNPVGDKFSWGFDPATGHLTSSTDGAGNTATYGWTGNVMTSMTDPNQGTTLIGYDGNLRQIRLTTAMGAFFGTGYDTNGNESSITGPLGKTQLTFDGKNELLQTLDPAGNKTSAAFYPDGDVQSDTNARGYSEIWTIDSRGLTTSFKDYADDLTSDLFDLAGNKISETDGNQHTTLFASDADNRQTQHTSPMGRQDTALVLDKNGNVLQERNPAQQISYLAYDPMNRLLQTTDPMGFVQKTVYNLAGEVVATIDAAGSKWAYQYDGDGDVKTVTDPNGNKTQTVFDGDRNVIQTIDGRGNATNYTFNKDNYETSVKDANGNLTKFTVNLAGETTQITDAKNNPPYVYTFDLIGNPTSVTDPDGNKTQWTPDPDGNIIKTTDARTYVFTATFDGLDRPTIVQPPVGAPSNVTYDGVGNIKTQTVAGITTKFQYNPDDQLTTTINAKGGATIDVLGVMGEVRTEYDPNQVPTYFGYDLDFRQTSTSLGTGAVTKFTLDPAGNLIAEQDPDKNLTAFQLDKNANVVATVDPFGNRSTQTFDGDNNPVTRVDRDGRKITNTWDPGNRLTAQLWLAPNGAQADSLAWTYDKNDNMLTASNVNGGYTFTPDPANFVTSQADPWAKTLTFTPDADYNVVGVADSQGGTQTNLFDNADRLQSRQFVSGSTQARIDIGYNTVGNEIGTLTRYSDTAGTQLVGTTQDSYDAMGNITEMKHKNASGTVLEDFTYGIDNAGRVNSEMNNVNGTITSKNYSFDNANQLTGDGTSTWGFDPNGNRNNGSFQVGANNQLLSDGNWNYKYDPEENLVEKDGIGPNAGLKWLFTYNNLNEMTSATETNNNSPVVTETNLFDVFQNLLEQDISQNGGAATPTRFARQIVNLAGSASGTGNLAPAWAELNGTNQVTTRREYLDAVDALFAKINQSGTTDWLLTDHLGSNRGLMNNSGTLDDAITYDPWGKITSESNSANADTSGFTGGRRDNYTLQVGLGVRQEDTNTGRWTAQDLLGLEAGSNPNRYVVNSPVNFTDPTGLQQYGGAGGGAGGGMPFPGGAGLGGGMRVPGSPVPIPGRSTGTSPFSNGGGFQGFPPPSTTPTSPYVSPFGMGNMSWLGGPHPDHQVLDGDFDFVEAVLALIDIPVEIASALWDIPHGWGADLGLWERRAPNTWLNPATRMIISAGSGMMVTRPGGGGGWRTVTIRPSGGGPGVTAVSQHSSGLTRIFVVAPNGQVRIYQVGRYGSMPRPRGGHEAHHGLNEVWLERNFPEFDARWLRDNAPAVLMPNAPDHNLTRGVFQRWRAEIARRQGVHPDALDWTRVTPGEIWRLAEAQFNATNTPAAIRAEYWRQFNDFLWALAEAQ